MLAINVEKVFIFAVMSSIIFGCAEYYDYSPYETNTEYRDLTDKAIQKIQASDTQTFEPFSISIVADSHNRLEEANRAVKK